MWLKNNWFKVAIVLLALFAILAYRGQEARETKLRAFEVCLGDGTDRNGNTMDATSIKLIAEICRDQLKNL